MYTVYCLRIKCETGYRVKYNVKMLIFYEWIEKNKLYYMYRMYFIYMLMIEGRRRWETN